jgi:hypothetical protein
VLLLLRRRRLLLPLQPAVGSLLLRAAASK